MLEIINNINNDYFKPQTYSWVSVFSGNSIPKRIVIKISILFNIKQWRRLREEKKRVV